MVGQVLPAIQNSEQVTLVVNNGWMLTIRANGSAILVFGSNPMDRAESPKETFHLQEVYGNLVPKLKEAPEKGDVAVAIRASGANSVTARYIGRSEVKPIFAKALEKSMVLDKARFDALLKDHPIDESTVPGAVEPTGSD